jgi:hypothetical protein
MFVKRNRTRHAGKAYQSVLLVQGRRLPAKRPAGRPPADAPAPKTVVVHETLANLSRLPAELIGLIETYCQQGIPSPVPPPALVPDGDPSSAAKVHLGPCFGLLAGLHALARELGLVTAVGEATRRQRLALYLVYVRLCHQGSRLSAARFAEDHAVREVLEVGAFDEDDLYDALEYLHQTQTAIETALQTRADLVKPSAVFLYDVTSVYFEGRHNELAEYGYNRDGKTGKKQMVVGLLTSAEGEPLSIQLYPGNTSDPPTFLDAVQKLKVRFGPREIAVVGDRGMIKRMGKQALGEAGFRYVTALTDPQVRRLLKAGVLQMGLFEAQPAEVEAGGKRYILRCNPQTQARERARRQDQWDRVREKISARNQVVAGKARARAESSLRQAQGLLKKYRLESWITVRLEGRTVVWQEDVPAREKQAELDGCYVVESDVPTAAATPAQVHERYLDLTRVERDFRQLKTGLLEIRPVFLRNEERTRGHAVVSLLALKLARELERRVAPLGITVEDAVERLRGVRLVCLGEPSLGLWRLADTYPPAQREVLDVLPKIPTPLLSLEKPNVRRLTNPRQHRPPQ